MTSWTSTVGGRSLLGGLDVIAIGAAAYTVYSNISKGRYLEALEAAGAGVFYGFDLIEGQVRQKKFYEPSVIILSLANFTISFMNLLNGISSDQGEEFGDGAAKSLKAVATLYEAISGDMWRGDASAVYTRQNLALANLVQELAAIDREMKSILRTEAGQLDTTRRIMVDTGYAIVLAIPVALALYKIPTIGPEISLGFQITVAISGLSIAAGTLSAMGFQSRDNAARVRPLSERYNDVLAATMALGTSASHSGLSDTSTSPDGKSRPDSAPSDSASGSGFTSGVSTSVNSVASPGVGSEAQLLQTDTLNTPAPPDSNMSTLRQPITLSRVATSGGSQLAGQGSQTGGGWTKRMPTVQYRDGAATPKKTAPTAAGAASGAPDAERAPTGVQLAPTVGAEQPQ